jgi:predicted DNA-binding transcriptional regulator AlpA
MIDSPVAGTPGGNRPAPPPELVGIDVVARQLGISTRHVRRLVDGGKCPPPVRLGRVCRWNWRAVERWIADGCPRVRTVRAGGAA